MGFANIFRAFEELYMTNEGNNDVEPKNPCEVCQTPDDQKPMCFRGEKWCSEKHRKQIMGDRPSQERH